MAGNCDIYRWRRPVHSYCLSRKFKRTTGDTRPALLFGSANDPEKQGGFFR